MDGATWCDVAARPVAAIPVGRRRAAHRHRDRSCRRATSPDERTMMNAPARRLAPFVGAILVLPFANGINSVPIAAFLAPVLLLRFARTHRARVALPILYVVMTTFMALRFRGMIPLSGVLYVAV